MEPVDDVLKGLVEMTRTLASDSVGSIYLTGSRAFGSAVSSSDIDLFFVGQSGRLDDTLKDAVFSLSRLSPLICPYRLDVKAYRLEKLMELETAVDGPFSPPKAMLHFNAVTIKNFSRILSGTDIRDKVELPPVESYVGHLRDFTVWIISDLKGGRSVRPETTLGFPDENSSFYGYVVEGKLEHLVYVVGLIASTRIAQAAGEYVSHKGMVPELYRKYVGDRFSDFVNQIFLWCRSRWENRIPDVPSDRARLDELCEETLRFENQLLATGFGTTSSANAS
ncbi:MAG: hypothetical protein CME26_02035 [Gemmatimonadetes bacterium]|nr:hypothetical protein [Gemmatimonadota bacterium]